MLDYMKLADQVSALLKQKNMTFDNAFIAVMKEYPVITGEAWKKAKSEIGSILAKRPRKPRAKKKISPRVAPIFCVLATDVHSVEFSSSYHTTFKFGKGRDSALVLFSYTGFSSGASQPSEAQKREAKTFAEEFFKQKESSKNAKKKSTASPIVATRSSQEELLLTINEAFEALFKRTDKSVVAKVTRSGKVIRQKDVPSDLMRKARAMAMTHFKGASSLSLNFE